MKEEENNTQKEKTYVSSSNVLTNHVLNFLPFITTRIHVNIPPYKTLNQNFGGFPKTQITKIGG
jgi:hypothetical protein